MIIKPRDGYRSGYIRNTKKPYCVFIYRDRRKYKEFIESHGGEFKDRPFNEENWEYYRSYATITALTDAWKQLTKDRWGEYPDKYKIGKTDFSQIPYTILFNEDGTRNNDREKIHNSPGNTGRVSNGKKI